MQFQDGVHRCSWIKDDSDYLKYHDEEWGVPQYDDQKLFECWYWNRQKLG